MCPDAEAHERLHIAPNTNAHEHPLDPGEPPEPWLVTMFHRNDAARVWQPSDIRSIGALAASVEHLVSVVLERTEFHRLTDEARATSSSFINRAGFVRDRLRQVRQEITMQLDSFSMQARLCAIDLLEVCTRFHIMVEHRCCDLGLRNLPPDEAKFDSKMNMQMYTQALSGLMGLYEDMRDHGVACENEPEFQGYFVISAADPEVLSGRLAQLPSAVVSAPRMQRALKVLGAIGSDDFVGFFRELKQADYLTGCLMHKHFDAVREKALNAINPNPAMDTIEIFGVRDYGYHGVLQHERENGQYFSIDATLGISIAHAAQTDDLADTVNYAEVSDAIRARITGEPVDLIEKLAESIASDCLKFPQVVSVKVKVHKPDAPIEGDFGDVVVSRYKHR